MEKVDNILKCIFIVPATLAISFFVFVLLVIVSMFLLSITNAKLYIVAVCIIPACVAFTWLSTSYQLAAFYKKEITWLSYFLGCLTLFFICYLFKVDNTNSDLEILLLMFLSGAIPGLIFCLKVQKESNEKDQSKFKIPKGNI